MNVLKSKTFWGAVLVAGSRIVIDHSPQSIIENVGIILSAAGLRSAISKNGNGS